MVLVLLFIGCTSTPVDGPASMVAAVDACDAGDAAACARAAEASFAGRVVVRDVTSAARLYERACDGGFDDACVRAARLLHSGTGVLRDDEHAATLLKRACDADLGWACGELAVMTARGQGVPVSRLRIQELSDRAYQLDYDRCQPSTPTGCMGMAVLRASGAGVATDEADAVDLYQRACAGGEPIGCAEAGATWMSGAGPAVPPDSQLAVHDLQVACLAGIAGSCTSLGLVVSSSSELGSAAIGGQWFERGCQLGDPMGCASYGFSVEHGEFAVASPEGARPWLDRGCRGGQASACVDLVHVLDRSGDGPGAFAYLEQACNSGDGAACEGAGIRVALGRGVPIDVDRSSELFDRACVHQRWAACIQFRTFVGTPAEIARACDLGDEDQCEYLALCRSAGVCGIPVPTPI